MLPESSKEFLAVQSLKGDFFYSLFIVCSIIQLQQFVIFHISDYNDT